MARAKKVTRTDISSEVLCLVADTKRGELFNCSFSLADDLSDMEMGKIKRMIERKMANNDSEILVSTEDGDLFVTLVRVLSVTPKEELREMSIEDWFRYSTVVPGGRNGKAE